MKRLIALLTEEAGVSLCQEAAPRWASNLEDALGSFWLRTGPSPGGVTGVNTPTFCPRSSNPQNWGLSSGSWWFPQLDAGP